MCGGALYSSELLTIQSPGKSARVVSNTEQSVVYVTVYVLSSSKVTLTLLSYRNIHTQAGDVDGLILAGNDLFVFTRI